MRVLSWSVATLALFGSFACSSSSSSSGSAGSANAGTGNSGDSGNQTGGGGASASGGSTSNTGGMSAIPSGPTSASMIAQKLGRTNFLIGLGNDLDGNNNHDLDGAFRLGTTLDLHYAYLSAYKNADGSWGSWATWNADGGFVRIITDIADAHNTIPMVSLYAMAEQGDGNLSGFMDDSFEKSYWGDVKILFQRLGDFGKPALVHLEPDFWAYAEQQSKEDPTSLKVRLTANVPECAGLSDDLVGFGHCYARLARMYAPKTLIGFHASEWANSDPGAIVKFLNAVGADQTDVIFSDMLDRDAGCFEAGSDPACQRQGTFYWDESNQTSPNFQENLTWSKAISDGVQHPMIWWQLPLGVPSNTKGGTAGHYRDNRVHYIFSHIAEYVAAGGLGVAFGVGAGNQTTIDTDGGQFKSAVAAYYGAPVPLSK